MSSHGFQDEWNKMLAGEVYDAYRVEFAELLMKTRVRLWQFNSLSPDRLDCQKEILRSLLGRVGEKFHFNQPFRCDYGRNIFIGENFMANFNLTILDEAEVTIGDNVMIGPNVSIYTACHPLEAAERIKNVQWAQPVTIGDNVWIGGDSTILPGVTIGRDSVVGAGSVVTRDVPRGVVVAGNPARVIKTLSCSSQEPSQAL